MHVTFHVNGVMSPDKAARVAKGDTMDPNLIVPTKTYVSPKFFCELFPFHIVIDMNMRIKQCGLSVQKMSDGSSFLGKTLSDIAKLLHPHMEFTMEKLMEFINATYILEIKPLHSGKSDNPYERLFGKLTLKGREVRKAFKGLLKWQEQYSGGCYHTGNIKMKEYLIKFRYTFVSIDAYCNSN